MIRELSMEFLSFPILMQCIVVIALGVSFIIVVAFTVEFVICIKEGLKDERYEKEQMALLPLLLPFMTDKNLWTMHENGQHLEWRSGHFSLTVTPSGFKKRYRLCLSLDDRTDGESKLLELLFEENGCILKNRLTFLISDGMSNDLSQLPFHQMIESVLSDISKPNRP